MHHYSVHKLMASLVGLAFVVGGCDCFDPVADTKLQVEITEPAATVLTRADDANGDASDGFQLQVVALATDSEGSREPEIDSATLEIRQGGATVGSPVEANDIQGTTIRFPHVTVAPGEFTIFVQARERTRQGEVEKNITVPLVTNRPEVTAIRFEGDANGDGILNATESPSGQPVLIATIQRAEGGTARVLNAGAANAEVGAGVTIVNGEARIPLDALTVQPEGDYQLAVEATDTAGQQNQLGEGTGADARNDAAFVTLRVDRVAPTVIITSPTAGMLFGIAGDADNTLQNGYQLSVAGTVTEELSAAGLRFTFDTGADDVRLDASQGTFTGNVTVTTAQTGTTPITIQAVATDLAGNTGLAASVTFDLDLDRPTFSFVQPQPGTVNSNTVEVIVASADPQVTEVTLTGATSPHTEPVEAATGQATFNLSLQDDTYPLVASGSDLAGNEGFTSPALTITIDTMGCSFGRLAPVNETVILGVSADQDPMTPGLQYAIVGSTSDCKGNAVILKKGSTQVDSRAADATTGEVSFTVTLADGETATYTAELRDAAMNVSTFQATLTADLSVPTITDVTPAGASIFLVSATNENLIPMAEPGYVADKVPGGNGEMDLSATITGAAGGTLTITANGMAFGAPVSITTDPQTVSFPNQVFPHNSSIALVVTVAEPSGNSGSYNMTVTTDVIAPVAPTVTQLALTNPRTASVTLGWSASGDDGTSGSVTDYVVRWSTALVLPGGITTHAEFLDATRTEEASNSPFASPQTAALISGLPPINDYSVRVVARDEVGNLSSLNTNALIPNQWTTTVVNNPNTVPGNKFFGYHLLAAPLTGGADELIVGSQSDGAGKVYVYYDGAAFNGTAPQTLAPPDGATASETFGADKAAGYVDEVSPAQMDLIVGSSTWSTGRGRAFLFFGQMSGPLDPADHIEFRGTSGVGTTSFGISVEVVGDVNSDGYQDVLIGAPSEASGVGRAYLYYGRSRAAWNSLRTVDTDGRPVVLTSSADRVFHGTAGTAQFARRRGMTSLGDITGDGVGDFAIPAPRSDVQRMYLYSGAAVQTASAPIQTSDAFATLAAPGSISGTSTFGFGISAVGGLNFYGMAAPELIVGRSTGVSTIYIYEDGAAGNFGATSTIEGEQGLGLSLIQGDLNADGALDLAAGENATSSRAWLFFNHGRFDGRAGAGLHQARLATGQAVTSLGAGVAIGDFDGDGAQDFAAGDYYCGASTGPGCVVIWR